MWSRYQISINKLLSISELKEEECTEKADKPTFTTQVDALCDECTFIRIGIS